MIKNTIYTQRSIDNSWTTDTDHGIPSGVIVDLQITMPFENNDVVLASCRMDSNRQLTVIFRCGEQRIAWVTASESDTGVPISMDCTENVTAHILLGALPYTEAEYVKSPVTINPGLVHYYDKASTPVTNTKLTVVSAGEEIFDEELSSDMVIGLETTDLYYTVDADGGLTIKTDWSGPQLLGITREDDLVPVNPWIRSINHIFPDKDGNITIELSAEGLSAEATATDSSCCITLNATDKLNEKLAPEDLLDKYLVPNEGRDYNYYPLDDIYMYGGTLGTVRHTFETIGAGDYTFPYIELIGGTFTETSAELRTIEPLYDKVETTSTSESTTEGDV